MAKVDRKKLLKEPDEFLDFSDKAVTWARENTRTLILIIAAIVLAVGCVLGIQGYLSYRSNQGAEAFARVFGAYQQVLLGQAEEAQVKQVTQGLAQVVKEYGATPSGVQARMALAGLLLQQGDFTKAEFNYLEMADDPNTPSELLPLALRGLGQSLWAQKKFKEAAAVFGRAVAQAGPQTAALLKLEQAQAFSAGGDKDQAIAVYKGLIRTAPDTQAAKEAASRLADLGADPTAR